MGDEDFAKHPALLGEPTTNALVETIDQGVILVGDEGLEPTTSRM